MRKTHIALVLALLTVALATYSVMWQSANRTTYLAAEARSIVADTIPNLDGATAWINSPALTREALGGKVVLIHFGTYSCINWRRSLPYVRAWSAKYGSQGLVVVGVHSPEFEFEKDMLNVQWAVRTMDVPFAVAVDNDFKIWRAFGNQHWPALYLIDARGKVRYQHFGEGAYDASERAIQRLLLEAGSGSADEGLVSLVPTGVEAQANWQALGSPETYLGHKRSHGFSSPGGFVKDAISDYRLADVLGPNRWALRGSWIASATNVVAVGPRASIQHRFQARDLHIVLGPATNQKQIRFRVLIDGNPPGPSHGVDVDANGHGTIREQRMYHLIRQPGEIGLRLFEIRFEEAGAEAYAFTFG